MQIAFLAVATTISWSDPRLIRSTMRSVRAQALAPNALSSRSTSRSYSATAGPATVV